MCVCCVPVCAVTLHYDLVSDTWYRLRAANCMGLPTVLSTWMLMAVQLPKLTEGLGAQPAMCARLAPSVCWNPS